MGRLANNRQGHILTVICLGPVNGRSYVCVALVWLSHCYKKTREKY